MTTNRPGFTIWFTGLSGAGKSTLARALHDELVARGHPVEVLDGDEIRANLSKGLGFSKEDRDTHVRRLGYVARLLSRNGAVAIAAVISPYRDVREEIKRAHEAAFIEVFVECPIEELIRRDPKGLYARALHGQLDHFTGISDPYEPPASPDIRIRSDREGPEQSFETILKWLEDSGLVEPRA